MPSRMTLIRIIYFFRKQETQKALRRISGMVSSASSLKIEDLSLTSFIPLQQHTDGAW